MELQAQIFREYDIRGLVGTELDEDLFELMGKALAKYTEGERTHNCVVVGRDGRLSSKAFAYAAIDGLVECGVNVIDIGVVPTPLLYYSLFNLDVDGGVMITASHNPKEYNGMKVAVGKSTIHGEAIQELRRLAEEGDFPSATGPVTITRMDISEQYMQRILDDVKLEREIKVVVDAGNGPGGLVAVPLYERMGAKVTPLYCELDGTFPNHHPDPTVPANLVDLIEMVDKENADVGIAFDGDVDRIGVVDEKGEVIFGDKLLIVFARSILRDKPGATIISEVKGSRTLYEDVEEHGGKPVMYKTGHSLIKSAMKKYDAELAGEMSGHMFFRHRWFGFDDAIYSGARLLEILGREKKTMSEQLDGVPQTYSTPEVRIETKEARKFSIVEEATKYFKDELGLEVNTIDGARIEFPDGWGLLRASNTSPVLVMRCEAQTRERLDEIEKLIRDKVEELNR
jgi:phosphomannomutase/phosphoglucomutase